MTSLDLEPVADLFRVLAEVDFGDASPLYATLATHAADDPELLSLLRPAGPTDRLPHLLFAAVQYLLLADGSDPIDAFGADPFPRFREWSLDRRADVEALVATHVVQTNEVGRCAALLPCLAAVAAAERRPLAVIEVGSSAGLNLLFDRYRYDYGGGNGSGPADSTVVLRPRVDGSPAPGLQVPEVAWRRGLDRLPVDVTDDEAVRWLRACIWPEQTDRQHLLDHAVSIARLDPPVLIAGDAIESLPAVVQSAPADAALCIVHTAVLPYLPDPAALTGLLQDMSRNRPLWRVSGEASGLVPDLVAPPAASKPIAFVYGVVPFAVAGQRPRALARSGPHGTWIEWLQPSPSVR